jgi:hypothetical protein
MKRRRISHKERRLRIELRGVVSQVTKHYDPHLDSEGFCQCNCEQCHFKLSHWCICLDCMCDPKPEDHNDPR